jgi:hypothetical protein
LTKTAVRSDISIFFSLRYSLKSSAFSIIYTAPSLMNFSFMSCLKHS